MRYEEPYYKKPKRKTRRPRHRGQSLGAWLAGACLRLFALVLAVVLLAGGMLYFLPVSLLAVEPEGVALSLTDGLPGDVANILLLGLDATHENTRRSDSIIIASIGRGRLQLTSVLRDTLLNIPDHGPGKLNAAYAYGGAWLVARTLNENLRLNIVHYVAVDYVALIRIVDALGGVDIEISQAEMEKINNDINARRPRYQALGYTAGDLVNWGANTHLNGLQALTYARIRKLDSDFVRASRQRALLDALLKRLRESLWNPVRMFRLAQALIQAADTDMSPLQLISLGEKALASGVTGNLRLPVDGSYTDDGSNLQITDMQANIAALQLAVYDERGTTDEGSGIRD